jgi:hypothetical protein
MGPSWRRGGAGFPGGCLPPGPERTMLQTMTRHPLSFEPGAGSRRACSGALAQGLNRLGLNPGSSLKACLILPSHIFLSSSR